MRYPIGIVEEVIEEKIKEARTHGIKGYCYCGELLFKEKELTPRMIGGLNAFNYLNKLIDAKTNSLNR